MKLLRQSGTILILAAALAVFSSCGGDDDQEVASPTPDATPSFGAGLSPPLEGPRRPPGARERTNFRDEAEYQLTEPADLAPPPAGATGAEFAPPAEPTCPDEWQEIRRTAEGFLICFPEDWMEAGHGYIAVPGAEDRYYALGVYMFAGDGTPLAHVSVYMTTPFSRPYTYTRDCDEPYSVVFAGQPAVLCPDHPGVFPEAKIIAYHVRSGDRDFFVNVVPRLEYDPQTRSYDDDYPRDLERAAIEIAHTFQLLDR